LNIASAIGGDLVPLGGPQIVLRHAETAGIEFGKQRHRLGVGIILGAVRRLAECGQIEAALERSIGCVRIVGRIAAGDRRNMRNG
jgi:hypothetical protein